MWIFSFSRPMLHKPVATGLMHHAASPSSVWIITLSVNSVRLCCKYCCWESGCYSRGGSTRCRPSWDEPKHIPCVTVYLCWEEAWLTAAWHFIKQISGTLKPRPCRVSGRKREVVEWCKNFLSHGRKHMDLLYWSDFTMKLYYIYFTFICWQWDCTIIKGILRIV